MPDLWLTVVVVLGVLVLVLGVVLARRCARAKQARLDAQPLDVTQTTPRKTPATQPEPQSTMIASASFQPPVAPPDQARGLGWMKASDLAKRSPGDGLDG
ncbi:MAG: hypothetical protein LBV00_08550 [Propionibacteriaceae bacterium]|jgi:hypothetical protein|nr:hypothetical protein [Propionibacteriaceae bacterium]